MCANVVGVGTPAIELFGMFIAATGPVLRTPKSPNSPKFPPIALIVHQTHGIP